MSNKPCKTHRLRACTPVDHYSGESAKGVMMELEPLTPFDTPALSPRLPQSSSLLRGSMMPIGSGQRSRVCGAWVALPPHLLDGDLHFNPGDPWRPLP
jgi:hypothetical protein